MSNDHADIPFDADLARTYTKIAQLKILGSDPWGPQMIGAICEGILAASKRGERVYEHELTSSEEYKHSETLPAVADAFRWQKFDVKVQESNPMADIVPSIIVSW